MRQLKSLFVFFTLAVLPAMALAETTVPVETQFVFNTLLLLIGGFLVMFMAAGFCMLEAGLVRSSSVSTICIKNIALYAIAGIMFYLCGYHLMYTGVDGGYFGSFGLFEVDDSKLLSIEGTYIGEAAKYSTGADWFFQMVFVGTAASIVSGAVAERVKMWSFLLFVVIMTAFIYPVVGAWHWGGGWLKAMGFFDFAGSSIVHSVGGWAALAGLLMIGPRMGRYNKQGKPMPMPGSSLPLAALGTFILWFGWFGFNGASQLALGTAADAASVAIIFINTNISASAGLVAAMIMTQLIYRKIDPTITLNGALAGLVSITAEPLTPTLGEAAMIGAVGSVLMTLTIPLLDRLKIDDVVGAIPVHLVAGIWGTLAVPITNPEAVFSTQIIGIISIAAFVLVASTLAWTLIHFILGLRISEDMERAGIDIAEVGLDAYPEFVRTTQR